MKFKWLEPTVILKCNKNTWSKIKNKYKIKTLKELFKILSEVKDNDRRGNNGDDTRTRIKFKI